MRFINLFNLNYMLMRNNRVMTRCARNIFHGKISLKNCSISGLKNCTNLHVRYSRFYN
jgi:hypothetical protein